MAQLPGRSASLFCWLFIVIGLAAVGVGISMTIKSLRSESWPVTDGIAQSSQVKSQSGHKGGTTYSAAVTYTYNVGGVAYTGDKVSIGQMSSSSSSYALATVSRYPVGKTISVHYAPGDPADVVLEPGIHGGTWICLGVGTAFALFGTLFLQIQRAAAKAQLPGAAPSGITMQPNGNITMDKPPVLMGVIFLLVGVGLCFIKPDSGTPNWIMLAVGSAFAGGGLLALLARLENKIYSKIMTWVVVVLFLAIFNWLSFGAGDRTGTVSSSFSASHFANVRTPFAIFTLFFDVLILAGILHALFRRRND